MKKLLSFLSMYSDFWLVDVFKSSMLTISFGKQLLRKSLATSIFPNVFFKIVVMRVIEDSGQVFAFH